MRTIRILILEDDLETLSKLLSGLHRLEELLVSSHKIDLAITVLSEYTQVEDYINPTGRVKYDIILLDRDCKAGGSFHVLDTKKFNPARIISISSVPDYNEAARKFGVNRIVHKDYSQLGKFVDNVISQIEELITN